MHGSVTWTLVGPLLWRNMIIMTSLYGVNENEANAWRNHNNEKEVLHVDRPKHILSLFADFSPIFTDFISSKISPNGGNEFSAANSNDFKYSRLSNYGERKEGHGK